MNVKKAYSILGIPETATPEEAKKKYRELSKKYHPDINKDDDAEAKIKEINEAYQVISSGKSTDREDPQPRGNPFNPFAHQQTVIHAENINLQTSISFKESILGCKREIKFSRKTRCADCGGQGEIALNNGCTQCGGRGQVVNKQGNMVFVQTCNKCYGKSNTEPCKTCRSEGVLDSELSFNVTIRGGIKDSDVLRLNSIGNYVGNFGPIEQHTDVYVKVSVSPSEDGLTSDGTHVFYTLDVSLLEALAGCKKTVPTILGHKDIEIPVSSKNKDEVSIPNAGVNQVGAQKVILQVRYPQDIDKLVNLLKDNEMN